MDLDSEVKQIIAKQLKIPVDQLTDDKRLEELGAQSLEIIEIVFELEEKFDIAISVKPGADGTVGIEVEGQPGTYAFSTIGEVVEAVKKLVAVKAVK